MPQTNEEWQRGFLEKLTLKERLAGIASSDVLKEYTPEERLKDLSLNELLQALSPEILEALRKHLDKMAPRPDETLRQADPEPQPRVARAEAPSEPEGECMSQEEWFARLPPDFANYLRAGAKLLEARAQARDRLREEYEERAKRLDDDFAKSVPARVREMHQES